MLSFLIVVVGFSETIWKQILKTNVFFLLYPSVGLKKI